MGASRLLHFSAGGFGRPFEPAVAAQARAAGLRSTLVLPDPVRGMTPLRRRRTRITRPLRCLIEVVQRRQRVWLAEDVNDPRFVARIPPGAHGLITGYPQIFRQPAISRFRSFVNLHPSLLPLYRGPDPFAWLTLNGETESGYTLHEVTTRIDDGPILYQEAVAIGRGDDWGAVVDAAIPTVFRWINHLGGAAAFPHRHLDARSVYRVAQDYTPLLEHRRGAPAPRRYGPEIVRLAVPARVRRLFDLGLVLRGIVPLRAPREWEGILRIAEEQHVLAGFWAAVEGRCDRLPREVVHRARELARDEPGRVVSSASEAPQVVSLRRLLALSGRLTEPNAPGSPPSLPADPWLEHWLLGAGRPRIRRGGLAALFAALRALGTFARGRSLPGRMR